MSLIDELRRIHDGREAASFYVHVGNAQPELVYIGEDRQAHFMGITGDRIELCRIARMLNLLPAITRELAAGRRYRQSRYAGSHREMDDAVLEYDAACADADGEARRGSEGA